ncbi:hypothetical protein RF11_13384 [Thelohanellus kitauei]|uniref:Uncharacterized protein n=1 Tax=Thelohanellus kitauei TaxID=669202 RepID=A0A0C2ITU3_THEKT|nr:hypothetical protein RF11_13384 [Thelohanellus kitauei]
MLKLLCSRYLLGRYTHTSMISSLISAEIQQKQKLLDTLRSIPLNKPPHISERKEILQIYPSSEEDHREIQVAFSNKDITFSSDFVDNILEVMVIGGRLKMNFIPDGYDPLPSVLYPDHYELFNISIPKAKQLLFLSGHKGK